MRHLNNNEYEYEYIHLDGTLLHPSEVHTGLKGYGHAYETPKHMVVTNTMLEVTEPCKNEKARVSGDCATTTMRGMLSSKTDKEGPIIEAIEIEPHKWYHVFAFAGGDGIARHRTLSSGVAPKPLT